MGFVKTHRRHSPLRVHPSPPSPDPRPYASLRPRHSQITAFLPTDSGGEPDFQIRMRQFFDHYLWKKPSRRWMESGRSFLQKGRDLEMVKPKRNGGGR